MIDAEILGDVQSAIADIIRTHIAPLCPEGSQITVVVRDAEDNFTVVGNDPDVAEVFAGMSEDTEVTYEGVLVAPGGSSVH